MAEKPHINIITSGHVDHGKSTLIGRLLFDSGSLDEAEMRKLKEKAKELKKKYKWLQAAEFYKKAFESSLNNKNLLEASEFQEKVGFCFYRAALQAKNKIEFRS